MQTFSYKGCQNCLVKACCQNVCEEYRQHVYKTKNIAITIDRLSLEESENAVANAYTEAEWSVKTDDGTIYNIKLNTGIKGIV